MEIQFNHYQMRTLDINNNPANLQLLNTKDCVYYAMINLLKYDIFLKDFWHENDIISTTCKADDYEGNVVVYFQRGNTNQKMALFCFCRETGLCGQTFYACLLSTIKEVYSEELI